MYKSNSFLLSYNCCYNIWLYNCIIVYDISVYMYVCDVTYICNICRYVMYHICMGMYAVLLIIPCVYYLLFLYIPFLIMPCISILNSISYSTQQEHYRKSVQELKRSSSKIHRDTFWFVSTYLKSTNMSYFTLYKWYKTIEKIIHISEVYVLLIYYLVYISWKYSNTFES